MEISRKGVFFVALTIGAVAFGILAHPCVPFFIGVGAMMFVWAIKGGLSAGNPFSRRAREEGKLAFSRSYFKPLEDSDFKSKGPLVTSRDYMYIFLWGLGLFIVYFALTALSIMGWLNY